MPSLVATGLVKRFGGITAVDEVSFAVNPGEVVGLLGPNGAGKTTTLRMVAGILEPDAGEVRLGDVDVIRQRIAAKRRMGFLSGDTRLYQRLSSREMLWYFGRLHVMGDEAIARRVGQLARELEMEEFLDRPCGSLSSGQKQRANIARAFLHEPDLLILDEPTAALDVMSGQFIVQAIRRERGAGRTILFSTHVMGEAEYLCDRIVLLHRGRVIDAGTLSELLARSRRSNLTDTFLLYAREGQESRIPNPESQGDSCSDPPSS